MFYKIVFFSDFLTTSMVGGLGVVGIVGGTLAGSALTLFLLRQYVSSKWGYFKSDRNLKGQVISQFIE